jgi:hypothetical protein
MRAPFGHGLGDETRLAHTRGDACRVRGVESDEILSPPGRVRVRGVWGGSPCPLR